MVRKCKIWYEMHMVRNGYGTKRLDTVQNDHKPLASILSKPLSRAPKLLQDIMMKLFRYNVEFGVNLFVADTLS